ncbi:hypothetical protein D3C72_1905760 [compost metagenome]
MQNNGARSLIRALSSNSGSRLLAEVSWYPDNSAMLGLAMMSRSFSSSPSSGWLRTLPSTLRMRSESPPISKKLSVTPTCSSSSTSCQISARRRSSSLRGAT